MAQTSLLQGKRFYCREWLFHKIQLCLQEKSAATREAPPTPAAKPWGLLLLGGPGSGKTALCSELLWPGSPQRGTARLCLAFHFCRADDADTLSASGFVRGLAAQICRSGLVPQYEEKIRAPGVQEVLRPGECERNPGEAFRR